MQKSIMSLSDTIAAPATGSACQPISIVRICGKNAQKICSGFIPKISFEHQKALPVKITDNGKLLDKAVVVYFKKPNSFTGEDTVEISCHGSPYIVSKIMELAIKYGARSARPGEFSMRAYLNGKIDLAQAEGIAGLITGQTQSSHRAALNLTEGRVSQKLNAIKTNLVNTLARIEAGLDDPDEEILSVTPKHFNGLLNPLCKDINGLIQTFALGKFVNYGIKTAIIGAPNCGKSSLLNSLLEKDRVIVSHIPGTTRDTIEQSLDLNGHRFILIDTAGIRRHALNPAEKEGMCRSQKAIDESDVVLFVSDVKNIGSKSNTHLWNEIRKKVVSGGKKIIKVVNKCDLLKGKIANAGQAVYISCKTGDGIEKLKRKMVKSINFGAGEDELIITCARHYERLKKAYRHLTEIKPLVKKTVPAELAAEHIRLSLKELTDIVGETTPDDVLDVIFKNFCFGK